MTNLGSTLHGFANSSFSAADVILQVHILYAPVLKHVVDGVTFIHIKKRKNGVMAITECLAGP